ncbi:alpha/beta fold hydrolase [Aquimarina brevivitae]|uniref:Pimeloyl-ACP methyl ester carboxylesterase n=1 Tax=Aquimarina brevivitae TaxID=323412 RepID=A0A4V2F5Q8_9FLAO|nr:alpha/beta hydrolase [Aquimarina brevivitae]RZS93669.1 pimeloyl-ACP methyl ester carboxylesterase [Aquimarina brevivitae]
MELTLDGTHYFYKVYGSPITREQPTILFLHDSLGCTALWRDFPKQIAETTGLSCISFDRQGYGKSSPFRIKKRKITYLEEEAHTLLKIIQGLHLDSVILFGHSDGGSIALLTAALFPEQVKAVITEGAHVFVEEITLQGIRDAVDLYQTTDLKQRLTKYHGEKTEKVFKLWTETWLDPSFSNWNIEKYLNAILCPSLIIQGKQDEYGSLAQVDSITTQTSGESQSLIIPDVGHTPHKEDRKTVIAETISFIKRLSF